jgi:APA family basic amino acid/polyamine antiporter
MLRPVAARRQQLRRSLSLAQAVALGIGGTIGGGVYVLVGAAAGKAGPAALLAFVLAFTASVLIALPYAELACRFPTAGGGYAFAREVLGARAGFVMGWGFWGAYLFISGYVTLGFGGYLHVLTGVPTSAGACAVIAICLMLNLLGARITGVAQAVVVAVAVGGLLAFGAWGLGSIEPANLDPLAPKGAEGVLLASLLTFLAFGGFDMVAAAGEEIERPERNLPRAILITLAAVLGVYLLVCVVAIGVMSSDALASSSAPLADAAQSFGGPHARALVMGTALLTLAATTNATMLVTSRISFAMARDRLLPSVLADVRPRSGAPAPALVLSASLLALVALVLSSAAAASIGGFLYVLHFVVPLVVLIVLRRRGADTRAAFSTPAPRVVLPLAFAACGVLVAASGTDGALGGLAWLTVGVIGHAAARRRRFRRQEPAWKRNKVGSCRRQRSSSGVAKPSRSTVGRT